MKRDPFVTNQIKIARQTLKYNDVVVELIGGMTKTEARAILTKYGKKNK